MEYRTYGGIDRQTRRLERRARLIQAGLELLGTRSSAPAGTRQICKVARVGTRYFYENFDDMDALCSALFESVADEIVSAGIAAVAQAPATLESKVSAAIRGVINVLIHDPRKMYVLYGQSLAFSVLAEGRCRLTSVVVKYIVDQVRLQETSQSRLLAAIRFCISGTTEILAAYIYNPHSTTCDEVIAACTDLCVASTSGFLDTTTNPPKF